jgi:hypothetical protein
MGAKRHKGKGNVNSECKKKAKFARGIFSQFVICLDSSSAKTKETIDLVTVFSGEEKSP